MFNFLSWTLIHLITCFREWRPNKWKFSRANLISFSIRRRPLKFWSCIASGPHRADLKSWKVPTFPSFQWIQLPLFPFRLKDIWKEFSKFHEFPSLKIVSWWLGNDGSGWVLNVFDWESLQTFLFYGRHAIFLCLLPFSHSMHFHFASDRRWFFPIFFRLFSHHFTLNSNLQWYLFNKNPIRKLKSFHLWKSLIFLQFSSEFSIRSINFFRFFLSCADCRKNPKTFR